MVGDLRLGVVLSAILAVASAQDISQLSALYFPDGAMPPVHPEPTLRAQENWRRAGDTDEWRLPKNLSPQRYNIYIEIDPEQEGFSGTVEITFKCNTPTSRLTLHAADLEIVSYSDFTDFFVPSNKLGSIKKEDSEHKTLTFIPEANLTEQHMYQFDIQFKGKFSNELNGLYKSNYTQNGQTKHLAVTHFEPTRARKMFPCFDEPDFKAAFIVRVKHPRKYSVLSNAPLQGREWLDYKNDLSTFEPTVIMSTYLLAIVVSEYKSYSQGNALANVWAREEIISGAKFSHELSASALQRLEKYTAIRFPMQKIDHVAVPHFGAGAMENYGLITYREPYLSLEEKITKTLTKIYTVTVTAHELAHQWFGNLVTPKWWSYTWLNEAFATYFAYFLPGEDVSWRLREQFIPAKYQSGMEVDQDRLTSVPMTSDASTPDEIQAKFDQISYSKGASVLRMFSELLGADVFQEALQHYLISRSSANAEPSQLFSEIAKVANKSTNALPEGLDWLKLGRSWTEQAGLPLVRAERNYETGEVKVTQSHFCVEKCSDDSLDERWWIPISWDSQSEKDIQKNGKEGYHPQFWLSGEEEQEVKFKTTATSKQWILINPKAIGYYRVTYDDSNWNLLAEDLLKNTKSFSTENRAQILHDVIYLALGNKLSFPVALNNTLFLQNDDDFVVWMSGIKVLRILYDIVGATDDYEIFREYAQKLLGAAFAKVTLEPSTESAEAIADTILRAYIAPYACMYGDPKCLKGSKALLEKLLSGSSVHPDVETPAACGGVQAGDADLFWTVRQKAIDHSDAHVQEVLLAALTCSKDNTLIKEHLIKTVFDPNFPKDKIYTAIASVVRTLPKFDTGLQFIQENYKKIKESIGEDSAKRLLGEVTLQVRTKEHYKNVGKWFSDLEAGGMNLGNFKGLLKKRFSVVEKYALFFNDIAPWLRHLTGHTPPAPPTTTVSVTRDPEGSHAVKATGISLFTILSINIIVKFLQR